MNKKIVLTSIKKRLNVGNLLNIIFVATIILLLVYPPAKAMFIRALMKVGFFQPDIRSDIAPMPIPATISFRDSSGRAISLASLRGKVVFINFWATWCPPCLAELPSVNTLYREFRDNKNVVFLTVDTDSDLQKSILFITRHQYQLPVYMQASVIPSNICGTTIPTTIVIDKLGQMVFHHEGAVDYTDAKFADFLKALVAN